MSGTNKPANHRARGLERIDVWVEAEVFEALTLLAKHTGEPTRHTEGEAAFYRWLQTKGVELWEHVYEYETDTGWVVHRSKQADIEFTGRLIAEVENSPNPDSHDFSGVEGRSMRLRLWRTIGGQFVCQKTSKTQIRGEVDKVWAGVCADAALVIVFFGFADVAKKLYDKAGIKATEVIP